MFGTYVEGLRDGISIRSWENEKNSTDVSDYAIWMPCFSCRVSDTGSKQCPGAWLEAKMNVQGVSHQTFRPA